MFNKKTIKDIEVTGKKVLVRVDFNVPIKDGIVSDDTRIRAALPTIRYLIDHNAAVILCSHLGRPKGGSEAKFSLKPVAEYLATLVEFPIHFAEDCIGDAATQAAGALQKGEVLVLENTRFHVEEEKNDPEMAQKLAALADVYVNDAFGSAHRAHASTEGVTHFLPSVAGFLMEKEIQYLGQAIDDPKQPFVAILGGAKIGDKIGVIKNLLTKAETILIGGGMANTFFAAQGYPLGSSLVDNDSIEVARELLQSAGARLRLPVDVVIAQKIEPGAETRSMDMGPIPDGWSILDIGPATVEGYAKVIATAGTIVWNGPMGVFEVPEFAQGTLGIAKAVAGSNAVSVIGGGESVAAIQQSGLADKITHISTGGGASLEMLEGLELPGVAALQDK
ncbi:MAG: phosphoglycerate kinase [Anaerolineae bacterium]|jgi:phosphoglycerate kinase|nr:phosphoglycerate kinase [Anaerolineae bacterium]